MSVRFSHTNIIATDWRGLADFYIDVFDCSLVPPERDLAGDWLSKGTGVDDAHLTGVHLRLPGLGEDGPTLEIYSYDRMEEKPKPAANRRGLAHLAFTVNDVSECLNKLLQNGGDKLGEIVQRDVAGVGRLTFVYATDPEGNILEIQNWS